MKSTYDLIGTFWDGRPADAVAQTVPYDPLMPEAGTPYCLFDIIRPSVKPPVGIEVCPVRHAYLLNGRFINAALTQQLFLRFFPDTPFPVLPSVVVCHSYFLHEYS